MNDLQTVKKEQLYQWREDAEQEPRDKNLALIVRRFEQLIKANF